MWHRLNWMVLAAALAVLAFGTAAQADVFSMGTGLTSLETVPVGNLGNAGELSGEGVGYGYPATQAAVVACVSAAPTRSACSGVSLPCKTFWVQDRVRK